MSTQTAEAPGKGYSLEKLETGIPGLDDIAMGGLPKNRITLVAGTSGSAKTVLATQFLAEGVPRGENAVFVTFEEAPMDIRKNMFSFGWDIERFERDGKWAFVDGTPRPGELTVEAGSYDLNALLVRIQAAVERVGATRLALDSLGAVFSQFHDKLVVRRELFRIASALKQFGLTTLVTAERVQEYGEIARFGVEEFAVDNVIIMRNALEAEKRRRTIEILKFRGTNHRKGEFPFSVMSNRGLIVIPIGELHLQQKSSGLRCHSGNTRLDAMCDGGVFRDSIMLVSGPTGCGKTLLATEFIDVAADDDERGLFFAFEESRDQLFRNASGWGRDFEALERRGQLKVIASYPETAGLEDHLVIMKSEIDNFKPTRIVVDSLSALERVSNIKGYREFVIGLSSYLKQKQITGLFTCTAANLTGGGTITEQHVSSMTDSIILLRYVEMFGEIKRGLTILKMRGSAHDRDIREFTVDSSGMHIAESFNNVTGILSGNPRHVAPHEHERLPDRARAIRGD